MTQPEERDEFRHGARERVYILSKNELHKHKNNARIANKISEKSRAEKLRRHTL